MVDTRKPEPSWTLSVRRGQRNRTFGILYTGTLSGTLLPKVYKTTPHRNPDTVPVRPTDQSGPDDRHAFILYRDSDPKGRVIERRRTVLSIYPSSWVGRLKPTQTSPRINGRKVQVNILTVLFPEL